MKFPVDRLLEWYRKNKRDLPWRKTKDIYAVWVSEIMLQQTQAAAVIPYYNRFMQQLPTVEHLARATEEEVLKLWEGMGYYTRARNLHRAARQVVEENQGKIPQTLEEFRALPGVGPYVAAAVLSIAGGMKLPAVDGNVMRVYTRYRAIPGDIRKNSTRDRIFKALQAVIPAEAPGDFNQAVMELGAMVCTPKSPQCPGCPLDDNCRAYRTHTVEHYPFKTPQRETPEYNVSIGIILKGEKFYIQKRPSEGHLGGLWEFPGGKAEEGETAEEAVLRECKEELGTGIEIIKKLAVVDHAYSHFKIHMSVFLCRLAGGGGEVVPTGGQEFRWITVSELENYPFPGANHKFFAKLREAAARPA